jgi:hypothetical protein
VVDGRPAILRANNPGKLKWRFAAEDTAHLLDSIVAGGNLRLSTQVLEDGRRMRLFCAGSLPVSDAVLKNNIAALAKAQAAYLPEDWRWPSGTGRLTVVAIGRGPGRLTGSGRRGGLVLELGSGVRPDDLALLVAHELFHTVNGHLLVHRPEEEFMTLWFKEGVTSWVALVTAVRAGLLDDAVFLDKIGEIVGNYRDNPLSTRLPAWKLAERFWRDPHARRLPYDKGALLGMLMDGALRDSEGQASGLERTFRAMLSTFGARRAYGSDDVRQLVNALSAPDGEMDEVWTRFVLGVDPLPVDTILRGLGLVRYTERVKAPYYGFRVGHDPRGAFVSTVDPQGPAARSGLAVGDRLVAVPPGSWEIEGKPARVDVVRGQARLPVVVRPVAGTRVVHRVRPLDRRGTWRRFVY